MLGHNRATALFNHVCALEALQEVKDDAAADYNARKKLCKEDGFDTNVVAAIMKRRKNGDGQTQAFDELLREYENAIEEHRAAPFHVKHIVDVTTHEQHTHDSTSAIDDTSIFDDDGVRP